jgi:protein-S-isoprenylcysteine O-methyltransferase Ste14
MFLHFFVGGVFLIFMMMAYSHWSLHQSVVVDCAVMLFMAILWLLLYVQARINRKKCAPQMYTLEALMHRILK